MTDDEKAAVEKARRLLELIERSPNPHADPTPATFAEWDEYHVIMAQHGGNIARALIALADRPLRVPDDEAMLNAIKAACPHAFDEGAERIRQAINAELARRKP